MKHRVIITQENRLDTEVEAPANASLERLAELALERADDGDAAFECTGSDTLVGPPEGGDLFRYLRDTNGCNARRGLTVRSA